MGNATPAPVRAAVLRNARRRIGEIWGVVISKLGARILYLATRTVKPSAWPSRGILWIDSKKD
jgi:hypothetical protein